MCGADGILAMSEILSEDYGYIQDAALMLYHMLIYSQERTTSNSSLGFPKTDRAAGEWQA